MGTSSNHGSPKTPNWKAVSFEYKYSDISYKRIVSDVWAAAENQPKPLSDFMKNDVIFRCQEVIRRSENIHQAYQNVENELLSSKQNSIIAEFAKRAIPVAFKSKEHTQEWRSVFFSEVTNYLVSRDLPGYVGKQYRNKTIEDMMKFKEQIKKTAYEIAKKVKQEPSSVEQWKNYVTETIKGILGT
jgi:hypothetical protein